MSNTEQKLERAQSDLARIETEQQAKVAAVNAAFDADSTEQNAEAISATERVAALMIGKAKAKISELEKQLEAERRESLEAEVAQLRAVVDNGVVELEPLIDRGFELGRDLPRSWGFDGMPPPASLAPAAHCSACLPPILASLRMGEADR